MAPLTNADETTPLSNTLFLTAAEQTWPGQVPEGSPSSVAQGLHDAIDTLPCLSGRGITERLLKKLDAVQTNRDVLTATQEILEKVRILRDTLEENGILKPAQHPSEPLIAAKFLPDTDTALMPHQNAQRLNKNAELTMIMHYVSRILAILGHVSLQIRRQALKNITPIALVDAKPIVFSGEIGSMQKMPPAVRLNGGKTSPKDFLWQGVTFNSRMKLIPILASLYLENAQQMSQEELIKSYKAAKAGESDATDANIYQLLRNISINFKKTGKPAPFTSQKGKGIRFRYDIAGPETIADTDNTQSTTPTNLPENTFLDAPFDPGTFTHYQPLKLKKLTEDSIEDLNLDDDNQNILKILLAQTEAIHIIELGQQCGMEIAEVNALLQNIKVTLWAQGFSVRIETQSDHIHLIHLPS